MDGTSREGRGWRAHAATASAILAALTSVACGVAPQEASSVESAPATEATTREAMQELFIQLQILLPAAVAQELGDPERAQEIGAAFDRMQSRIDALPAHGDGLDPGARMFGRELSRDVRRARDFFQRERYENSAFFIQSLVEDCTACHTRRAADDSLITRGFVEDSAMKGLDPLDLAAIAAATRRFEDAMDRYERAFGESGVEGSVLLGPLVRYLTVTLRVARDPARAEKTLRAFAAQSGMPPSVRRDVEHWIETLDRLSAKDFAGTTLVRARAAASVADRVAEYPGDPKGLVEYLVASSQLHDLVAIPQESPAAAAEIYELLANSELGVAQSIWLSRADLYWETAIRLAPSSPAAKRAFVRLAEETRAGYTGSGGTRLPAEEAARLAELSALVSGTSVGSVDGSALFADHCALCHGANGEGKGTMSAQLTWSPADLTRIATRRGGVFPEAEVFELIARRDPLGSHQSQEMPRWGKFWKDDSKIDALVTHLRSIQQP